MRILITGANGFLGRAVCEELVRRDHDVRALLRGGAVAPEGTTTVRSTGLDDEAVLRDALQGVHTVVHLAARVHQMREPRADSLARYRETNTEATSRLARLAATAGVGQFLFASSVKAVGESNAIPWNEDEPPRPVDPYGVSKLEAERNLARITEETGIATTVLRLPLMYGPEVRANMRALIDLVAARVPLPLGGIRNQRSLLYVGNAAVAFAALSGHAKGHEVFFAADGEDLSTPELVVRIADALGIRPRLWPSPAWLLERISRANLPRLSPMASRLVGSLIIDAGRLRKRIGPFPHTVEEGLRRTAAWYLGIRSGS